MNGEDTEIHFKNQKYLASTIKHVEGSLSRECKTLVAGLLLEDGNNNTRTFTDWLQVIMNTTKAPGEKEYEVIGEIVKTYRVLLRTM